MANNKGIKYKMYFILPAFLILIVLMQVGVLNKIGYVFQNKYVHFVARDMKIKETEHFIIRYEDEEEAKIVAKIGEKYYEEVSAFHNYNHEKKIPIMIYNRAEMGQTALLKDDNVPMGYYSAGVIQILSPGEWIDDGENMEEIFHAQGPVIHEMSHFMMDQSTGAVSETWIHEGIALYIEYKTTGYTIADESQYHDLYTIEELEDFNKLDKIKAYYSSFIIIKNIMEENDVEYWGNMLE